MAIAKEIEAAYWYYRLYFSDHYFNLGVQEEIEPIVPHQSGCVMSSHEPSVIARVAAQNPTKEIEPKFTIVEFEVGVGVRRNNEALAEYVNG